MQKIKKILCWMGSGLMSLTVLSAGAQQLTPDQHNALLHAEQGTVVKLPGLLSSGAHIPRLNYEKIILPGPQFIISDDPEYIRVPEGIALQEMVTPGRVRLYLYNVNGVQEPRMSRKITVVIKNTGKRNLHLSMLQHASQPPGKDYLTIGKKGLADFFASVPDPEIRTISPGDAVPLDPRLESQSVEYDELVHGIYEFVVDQPAQISVIQTSPQTSGPQALAVIKEVLPPHNKSGAGRGLYGVSNYQVNVQQTYDTKDGPAQLIVADGSRDPWIVGRDMTTGQQMKDVGNYGVVYHINIPWKSTDHKALALVTWNPGCGAMTASMIVSKGKFPEGIVQLPGDGMAVGDFSHAGLLVQLFLPDTAGEEQTIHMTYSPPGASCLPTPLVFIPVDLK